MRLILWRRDGDLLRKSPLHKLWDEINASDRVVHAKDFRAGRKAKPDGISLQY
jgi:hypothetical protein